MQQPVINISVVSPDADSVKEAMPAIMAAAHSAFAKEVGDADIAAIVQSDQEQTEAADDARIASTYIKQLMKDGIPPQVAFQFAMQYQALIMRCAVHE